MRSARPGGVLGGGSETVAGGGGGGGSLVTGPLHTLESRGRIFFNSFKITSDTSSFFPVSYPPEGFEAVSAELPVCVQGRHSRGFALRNGKRGEVACVTGKKGAWSVSSG